MGNDKSRIRLHSRCNRQLVHATRCNTQLLEASSRGKKEMVDLLLLDGASVNVQDKRGETSLMWAVKNRHMDVVILLVDGGADLNIQNSFGFTALHYAVSPWKPNMQMDILHLLISRGARLDVFDGEGKTPLMKACRFSNFSAALALIDAGADVNARSGSKDGYTALHEAAQVFNMLQSLQGEDYARRRLRESSAEPIMNALCQLLTRAHLAGGHADIPDRHGHDLLWHVTYRQCTRHMLTRSLGHKEEALTHQIYSLFYPLSLKCLAATALVYSGVKYTAQGLLPKSLIEFTDMHNPAGIKTPPTSQSSACRLTPQFIDWYSS